MNAHKEETRAAATPAINNWSVWRSLLVRAAVPLLALLLPSPFLYGQTSEQQALKARVEALKGRAAATRAELAAQRAWLQRKSLPSAVLRRQAEFESEFETRAATFERAAAAWQAQPSEAGQRELELVLKQYAATKVQPVRASKGLPWGAPKSNGRMPAESKSAWYRTLSRDERVQLVQAGGLTTVGGVRFSMLPEPGQAPQDSDLAETPDVQLTAAIRAKAQELGRNPVTIFNWVRNNVQFVPTWGAMQGADGALRNLRGNAIDTASLTIALLRASGIPARYQFGTVDVPAAVAMNWLGGLNQPEAALELLQQGGVAARGLSEGGQIKAIRMEHAWVSAYVNWSPSRGARDGGPLLQPPQHPNPNAALNAWTPLDAAFKQHRFVGGLNLGEVASFNTAAAIDTARQGATCTAASARQVNQSALAAHFGQFKLQAQQQLGAGDPLVAQVLGSTAITQQRQSLLPGTLAAPTVAESAPIAALTPSLRWKLQLGLWLGTEQVLGLDKTLPELQGQLLSLEFVPETAADAQILNELMRPEAGGGATGLPPRIAAYLAKFKAQVRLADQVVAEGGSFTLGQPLTLRSLLQNPEGNAGGFESLVVVGETHSWAVQAQSQGAGAAASVAQQLASLRGELAASQPPAGSEQARHLLFGAASAYQASLDAKARLYQRVAAVVETRLPAVVRASSRLETEEAFGLVTNVRPGGAALHADRLGSAVASRRTATAAAYGRQNLERASAEAHHLLNRLFGPSGANAQSALSGLASAAAQGQTVWRADSSSLAQVLAGMNADSSIRGQVEQAVANGMQALVSQHYAHLGGLAMDPLILLDVQTGTAAYSVASRSLPLVQLTAQRPGPQGWLGLADAQASKVLVAPALDAAIGQLNTAQALLGDIDSQRWQSFAGQADVIDGLYVARLSGASTSNACDWLISTLASQMGTGLPATAVLNRAPVILSLPVTGAQAEAAYGYAVQASDPDGDALGFALSGAPTGMTISGAGLIQWARAVPGDFVIAVQVSDGKAITEQRYTLTVAAAAGLNVGLALNPSIANPGQTVTLAVTATSAGGVTRTATIDGVPLPLNEQGLAVFAAPAAGAHPVVVTVSDGKSIVMREAILTVRDASDIAPPSASISSPQADAGLRGMVAITGSATDARFAYYKLVLRRVGEGDLAWQEIGRGLAPVVNGTLGQLDTSRYQNGLYQIGLLVVDVNGAQSSAAVTVEFLGNLKLGQFRLSFADVRAEAPGLPMMLTRTYDSTKKDVMGDFGWLWSASGQDITIRKNMALGLAWQVTTRQLQLCLAPVGRRRISIALPDGGLYRFDAKNAVECAFGMVPDVDIQFTALPGPTGGASGRVSAGAQLKVVDGAIVMAQGGLLVDADTGEPWNPKDFELTTEEGFKYLLREGVGILNVIDPYGNKVSYGAEGYRHSANLSVTLARDAAGRITRATDPNGKSLVYTYNARGELESVTDREGQVTRFTYATVSGANTGAASGNQDLSHLLASITDPRGQVVMNNRFDEYGRLTGTADALGQAAQQEFEPAANRQIVTDRRGNRTIYTFDADGNITQSVNALSQTTTFTFDANGNETSVTNALGEKTERTFDAVTGKQLSEKNPLGHTTSTAYSTVGTSWQRLNPLSTTDARGNVTVYSYEALTQPGSTPKAITEPLGRSTDIILNNVTGTLTRLNIAGEQFLYGYDSKGRKTSETNGLGQLTTYAYDANGNETSRTVYKSVNGATVTFTASRKYDSENRVIEETDVLGGKRSTSYNAAGKIATQTDSLGRVTRYSYDANARLTKTEYPDGSSESTSYDAEGNETIRTDRAGRTTRMSYDALNRLVRTDYPDASFEATEYDAAGRVTATIDRNGKRSTMEYDAAGRQTASVDATGRRIGQTFDENGNRTSVTVDGRTTNHEYDALNRLTKTTWPDGSTHTSVYRTDNRKQSETDPRGVTTSYGWDAAGRLASVAQSGVAGTTTYGYDETAAKVSQVDALGRTTSWAVDGSGRITARTIQDGTKETSSYDAAGNRVAKTTFAGEQFTLAYDSENRLKSQITPAGKGGNAAIAGASVVFEYTASGQLKSQQEQGATTLAGTQSYQYDSSDRLTQVSNAIGVISYGLDAAGNVTERSVTGAGTVRSEYDDAGRLSKVIAADGKVTQYFYDPAGRVVRVEREINAKNGQEQDLVTYNRYDSADRLIAVVDVKRVGATETLLAGQAIIRAAGGTITKIETWRSGSYDSASGQFAGTPAKTQAFEYDGNARLTRESSTKDGVTTDTVYEYDKVGNRTKKTVTSAAGTEITSYSYDSADRLTQESASLAAGGNRVTIYGWDGNGNLASKTEPGKVTLYGFDPQNRLIDVRTGATQAEASAATPVVSYAYDASGNRVRKGAAQASSYLIDPSHTYPQLALETRGADSTSYLRGLELIRQTKLAGSAAEDLFPLRGHLGTSLGAVDANGNMVEQTDVDAFGNLDQGAGVKQAHLYTGEYWDQDSQLLYLRARWYDPKLGRFISADPFEGKQRDARSLNRYSYAHSDPVHGMDPSGGMTAGEAGAAGGVMGVLSSISLPSIGTAIATARATHLAVASVPFMAVQGQRITQFIQGSGRSGFEALQRSVFMVARGAAATQQQIQSAWNVGSGYTSTLNQMMGARATQFGLHIHKLVEGSMQLPANFTYSLANMAPTPYQVHTAISALHSSRMFATGPSLTVREFLAREVMAGRLTPEQVYRIEAQIWAAAMQGQQLTARFVQMLASAS